MSCVEDKVERLCRLCLTNKEDCVSIFARDRDPNKPDLPTMVRNCIGVEIPKDDGYTRLVCRRCRKLLKHFNVFKESCLRSQTRLKEMTPHSPVSASSVLQDDGGLSAKKRTSRKQQIETREDPLEEVVVEEVVAVRNSDEKEGDREEVIDVDGETDGRTTEGEDETDGQVTAAGEGEATTDGQTTTAGKKTTDGQTTTAGKKATDGQTEERGKGSADGKSGIQVDATRPDASKRAAEEASSAYRKPVVNVGGNGNPRPLAMWTLSEGGCWRSSSCFQNDEIIISDLLEEDWSREKSVEEKDERVVTEDEEVDEREEDGLSSSERTMDYDPLDDHNYYSCLVDEPLQLCSVVMDQENDSETTEREGEATEDDDNDDDCQVIETDGTKKDPPNITKAIPKQLFLTPAFEKTLSSDPLAREESRESNPTKKYIVTKFKSLKVNKASVFTGVAKLCSGKIELDGPVPEYIKRIIISQNGKQLKHIPLLKGSPLNSSNPGFSILKKRKICQVVDETSGVLGIQPTSSVTLKNEIITTAKRKQQMRLAAHRYRQNVVEMKNVTAMDALSLRTEGEAEEERLSEVRKNSEGLRRGKMSEGAIVVERRRVKLSEIRGDGNFTSRQWRQGTSGGGSKVVRAKMGN